MDCYLNLLRIDDWSIDDIVTGMRLCFMKGFVFCADMNNDEKSGNFDFPKFGWSLYFDETV